MTLRVLSGQPRRALWAAVAPLFDWDTFRRQPSSLLISNLPLTEGDITRLSFLTGAVSVVIPQSLALERLVRLPRAAKAKSDHALSLYMKANMPQSAKGLLWTAQLASETEDSVTYRCLVIKENQILTLVERAKGLGARLENVRFASDFGAPLWQRKQPTDTAERNWAGATFLVFALTALGSILFAEFRVNEAEALLAEKTDLVAILRQRLADAQTKQDQTEDAQEQQAADMARFMAGSRPLAQIADIAQSLPDGVWLSELSFAGSEWRMAGFSPVDVPAVVEALQSLPWVQSVRLDGPVSKDSFSGQSRFDLSLVAKEIGAKP